MPLQPDIFNKVESMLKKHKLNEPDPEKSASSELSPFMAGFMEIVDFYKEHGRFPEKRKSIAERKLASRLKSISEDAEKRSYLLEHDSENILANYCKENDIDVSHEPAEGAQKEPATSILQSAPITESQDPLEEPEKKVIPESLKGIAGSSAFANLMGGMEKDRSLFGGRFAKKPEKEQNMPDYVAKRKDCTDFDTFRPFFESCIDDLRSGARKAIPFKNEQHIEQGKLYVLGGLLCYIAEKGKPYMHKGKKNTRLRLIFINERESNMLLRSLSSELYKGGLMITESENELFPDANKITPEDQETGWIYVLKSLSDNPDVKAIPNLFKIGFTSTSVEKRIAGAEKQVTYLMAPVEIAAKAKVANVSTHALEQLLHAVFNQARLEIEVTDSSGKTKNATEWFSVPWKAIEHSIQLIIQDQIQYYYYEPSSQKLEFRKD